MNMLVAPKAQVLRPSPPVWPWGRRFDSLSDFPKLLHGKAHGTKCDNQPLGFFEGYSTQEPKKPWPHRGDITMHPPRRG